MEEQEQKVEKQEVEEKEEEQEENENDIENLVISIKKEYEEKIASINEKNKKELQKRDNLIKQLIAGESNQEETPSIADKINAKRQFKKW